jgi:hypothetical protein
MSQDLQHEFLWYQAQIAAHLASAAAATTSGRPSAAATAGAWPGGSSSASATSPPMRRPGPEPSPASMALLEAATYGILVAARLARPLRPSSAPPPSSAIREHWLDSSLAESFRCKYRGPWEEWCAFAASHRISALPPDEYAAEQFIVEKAETTRLVASVETVVASINHFCARSKLTLPFSSPAFGLILHGIRRDCGCLAVPRQPFTAGHICLFLDLAWGTEDLGIWRGVFGHITCFQQLMRASKAFGLTGANLVVGDGVVKFINVKANNWQFGYTVSFSFPVVEFYGVLRRFPLFVFCDYVNVFYFVCTFIFIYLYLCFIVCVATFIEMCVLAISCQTHCGPGACICLVLQYSCVLFCYSYYVLRVRSSTRIYIEIYK